MPCKPPGIGGERDDLMMTGRWLTAAGTGIAIIWNLNVMAQGVGLQVADTANIRTAGETDFTAGETIDKHMSSTAVRGQISLQDDFRVFADLGWSKPDTGRGNIGVQGGGLYALDFDFISDLGLRVAGYYVDTDTVNLMGGNLMLLSSGELLLNGLFLYGGLGADLSDRETAIALNQSTDHTRVSLAATAGLLYHLTSHLSAYVEASHIDDPMIGFGLCYR